MNNKTKSSLFLWTALCMMGQPPSYATHPCEESGYTLKRKAGAPSLGERSQKKRRFKEDWFDLLSEQYLSPSDYEEYDLEDEDLQSAPSAPFDDQALEELADLYRYFPQDLFNYVLQNALEDHETSPLSRKAYRTLLSWAMVSKDYYERVTGYPYSGKVTHWAHERTYRNTVLNHCGLEIGSFLWDRLKELVNCKQSVHVNWLKKQKTEQGGSEDSRVLYLLAGHYKEEADKEYNLFKNKIKSVEKQLKDMSDLISKYYLEGTKVQKLPRYVIEAINQLSIPFNKLFLKSFASKGEDRFLSVAKRLEGTGVKKIKIDVTYKGYDRVLLEDTSLGIVQLMTHLPTQVCEMDLSEMLLTPSMMEAFALSSAECPLKKVCLSINPHQQIEKATWVKFVEGLYASKIQELSLGHYEELENYRVTNSAHRMINLYPDRTVRTMWLRDFFAAVAKKEEAIHGKLGQGAPFLKKISIAGVLLFFDWTHTPNIFQDLVVESLDLSSNRFVVEPHLEDSIHCVLKMILSAPYIQKIYFSPIHDAPTTNLLIDFLKKLESDQYKTDKSHSHTLCFPYDSSFQSGNSVWDHDVPAIYESREAFLKGLRGILPSNFVIKTLDGVFNPINY